MRSRPMAKAMNATALRSSHDMVKDAASRCLHGAASLLHDNSFFQNVLFWKEFCKKPRLMGAVCPSSRYLARSMAKQIPAGDGLVVELGAGTGMVTRALAEALGQNPRRLWALEQSRELAALLSRKLPMVHVLQGDARDLAHLLPENRSVDVIVSGLPLRAFSEQDVEAVTRQWSTVLAPGGFVVQFTYALCGADCLQRFGFYEDAYDIVWKNVPPARVQILKRIAD